MAYQVSHGTPIIWGQPGASGVTHDLSVDALADGAARMGEYADLGATHAVEYEVYLIGETGTAPTAANTLDAYLISTNNLSDWPAKVTGSDASYTLGTADANLRQAGRPTVSLIATNDANTVLRSPPVIWRPKGQYVAPILDNNLGQALRNETTDTDNDTRIVMYPRNLT